MISRGLNQLPTAGLSGVSPKRPKDRRKKKKAAIATELPLFRLWVVDHSQWLPDTLLPQLLHRLQSA